MAKMTSKELAWQVYKYNLPIDYTWVRYLRNKEGTTSTMRKFIEGYVEAEGINVSKNMITRAIDELYYLLR